jgi:hypothetical protein
VTAQQCACGCGRPVTDGYVAEACGARAAGHLAEIIDMTPAARLVAAGLVRRGGTGGGGKPGSRPPLNDGATDALNAVQNALTTLARDIAETRGLAILPDGAFRPLSVPVTAEQAQPAATSTPESLEAS